MVLTSRGSGEVSIVGSGVGTSVGGGAMVGGGSVGGSSVDGPWVGAFSKGGDVA